MPQFSSRVCHNLEPNLFSLALEGLENKTINLINFNPTELDLTLSQETISNAFTNINLKVYYPQARGLINARQAIADYYKQRGKKVAPNDLLLTASTSEAYQLIFKLFTEPGDGILIPTPGYPLFEGLAQAENIKTFTYELQFNQEWEINWLRLPTAEAIKKNKIKALIIVNPHNPTGHFFKEHEIAQLNCYLKTNDLILISDEVFADYHSEFLSLVNHPGLDSDGHYFFLSGISKVLALPHLKLSWLIARGPLQWQQTTLEYLETLNDQYLNLAQPVQEALPSFFVHNQTVQNLIRARIAQNINTIEQYQNQYPDRVWNLLPYSPGWYGLIKIPQFVDSELACIKLMQEHGIIVHPGSLYNLPSKGFWVISLLSFNQDIQALLEIIEEFWVGYSC